MRAHVSSALGAAAGTLLRTLLRVARQLFHEVTGSLFVLFAVIGSVSAWRTWEKGAAQWKVGLAIGFALMMAAFAVASFRSARRVR